MRILDRRKDVIIRGGYKVYSVAVENALAEHPQVVEAALVGVPCTVLGERVHAHVCVRAVDERSTAQALREFCAGRVADYAVPETWTIGTEPLLRKALEGETQVFETTLNDTHGLARHVIVSERAPARIEMAAKFGATDVIDPGQPPPVGCGGNSVVEGGIVHRQSS